jgi:hypothetical protein
MKNIHEKVARVIKTFTREGVMFTVYDVTRVLRQKYPTVSHDEVRYWVRYYFSHYAHGLNGYSNNTGDHLGYSPAPHIYAPPGADILQYDPKALDPKQNFVKSSKVPTLKSVPVTYTAYAVRNKSTGQIIRSNRSNNSAQWVGLYKDKNGPTQLIKNNSRPQDYEIASYQITIKPL